MSSKHFRTIHDFSRHGYDVELRCGCGCGHRAKLPIRQVIDRFREKHWPIDLDSAAARFRCSACGRRPQSIGPLPRD